jgi:sugar transferase (PEP-CTERM/EpsH1 system associated)
MRSGKRELIFISHRMPWPLNKGEKIRAWNLLLHLSPTFHIHLGCTVDDPADMEHIGRMEQICASVGAFPIDKEKQRKYALRHMRPGKPLMPDCYYSPSLESWVQQTMAAYPMDVVYIYSVAMAPYAIDVDHPCKILDAQDIDSEKWGEYATKTKFPRRLVFAREQRTLLAYERSCAAAAKWTFFVSQPEADRFKELAPEVADRVVAMECGVDLERFSPADVYISPFDPAARQLVFTGNMDYWPNADAAIWFAREVMPALRQEHRDLSFWVVGANPTEDVRALASLDGVVVTGRVEDVRPYVANATAIVCPLRIARGIQNKVLEGMAMGKIVIASPPAYEGVRAQAGRDLLVAEGVEGFVATVREVLGGAYPGVGRAARAAMERGYAWGAVLGGLDELLA